jgi:SOS-response transcriptional repressor LexA
MLINQQAQVMNRRRSQVRLQNLEILIAEAGSGLNLARKAETSGSYLSQVRRQLPTAKGTPRNVGDELASKLEQAMDKPEGWMDEPHEDLLAEVMGKGERKPNVEAALDLKGLYPLISWVQAGEWSEIAGAFDSADAEDWLPCPVRCGKGTFVLRVKGQSMEPRFHDGEYIFVDPDVAADNGKFVVVRLEDTQEATFKQLIVEGGRMYLRALNPDWPTRIMEVTENAFICGVVVFKGEII